MARRRLVLISILVGIAGGVFIVLAYRAQQTPTQRELFAQALNAGKTASERNYIFGEVAKAQANAGDYDAALSTILQIDRFAGQIPTEIVRIRLRKQDIEGAKKMLSQLPQSNLNNGARREIALAQASAGDLDGALKPKAASHPT
jgi:thioredoxin-like negative regulator of GroEL